MGRKITKDGQCTHLYPDGVKCDKLYNASGYCHIKPLADFPDMATTAEINHPDNLLWLCRNHHWEFDHGLLVLDKHGKIA